MASPFQSGRSANLALPLLAPAQARKHITVNEALCALDAAVQIVAERCDLQEPPQSPVLGERYAVAQGASGDWAGQDGALAQWDDAGWSFTKPSAGWLLWDRAAGTLKVWLGDTWVEVGDQHNVDRIGVNTQADDTNRLAVASDATLLTHAGSDHRVVVNRSGPGDTASLLFQTDYVGGAEIGMIGPEGFAIKVLTPEGWRDALRVSPDSGQVALPLNQLTEGGAHNLFKDGGVFMGAPQPSGVGGTAFVEPSWVSTQNGAQLSVGETFHYNSQSYGGPGPVNTAVVQSLADLTIAPAQQQYYRGFHTARITSGADTRFPKTFSDGNMRYLSLMRRPTVVPLQMTYSIYVFAEDGPVSCPGAANLTTTMDGQIVTPDLVIPADGAWHHIITQVDSDPRHSVRRDVHAMRFYTLPGERFQIAFPAAMVGILQLTSEAGQIPSLYGFAD